MMLISLFWVSLFTIFYVYVAYPALLWFWGRGRRPQQYEPMEPPSISIMISAYNEEQYIEKKIQNALSIDYPRERMQVIVISDGSTDKTLEIANSFDDDRLKVIEVVERKGKPNALNQGLRHATGEILVFTDANVFFDKAAIGFLINPFSNVKCGAVSGCVELVAMEDGEPLGEGAYMKYERFIQSYESLLHTMVGIDGGMFAIRRQYVTEVPEGIILDDFYLAMRAIANNAQITYEPKATAKELVPASVSQEFRRKTRIAAGGFQVLKYIDFLKRPFKDIKVTLFFVSHKLLRWLSPFFLIVLFFANVLLVDSGVFAVFLWLQFMLYGLALVGVFFPRLRGHTLVYVPYYFVAMNAACFIGFWKNLLGTQKVTWNRVDR